MHQSQVRFVVPDAGWTLVVAALGDDTAVEPGVHSGMVKYTLVHGQHNLADEVVHVAAGTHLSAPGPVMMKTVGNPVVKPASMEAQECMQGASALDGAAVVASYCWRATWL